MLFVPRLTTARRAGWGPLYALAHSLVAVVFFVVVLGLVFLPRELDRWRHGQHLTDSSCCVLGSENRQIVSLFWFSPKQGCTRVRWNLAVHDGSRWTELNFDWSRSIPTCLAAPTRGGALYAGDVRGAIYALDPQWPHQLPLPIGQQSQGVAELVVSPDGSVVVSTDRTSVYAWNPAARTLRWRRDDIPATCLDVDTTGRKLVCGTTDGELLEIDLASGLTLRRLGGVVGPVRSIDVSANGRLVAAVGSDGDTFVLRADSGRPVWPARLMTAPSGTALFSPCGRLLVTTPTSNLVSLRVWNVESGLLVAELRGHTAPVVGLSFAESGPLYSWGADGTIRTWDLRALASARSLSLASNSR